MNKNTVVETPTDKILDGVIVDIKKTNWRNIIAPRNYTSSRTLTTRF